MKALLLCLLAVAIAEWVMRKPSPRIVSHVAPDGTVLGMNLTYLDCVNEWPWHDGRPA